MDNSNQLMLENLVNRTWDIRVGPDQFRISDFSKLMIEKAQEANLRGFIYLPNGMGFSLAMIASISPHKFIGNAGMIEKTELPDDFNGMSQNEALIALQKGEQLKINSGD